MDLHTSDHIGNVLIAVVLTIIIGLSAIALLYVSLRSIPVSVPKSVASTGI